MENNKDFKPVLIDFSNVAKKATSTQNPEEQKRKELIKLAKEGASELTSYDYDKSIQDYMGSEFKPNFGNVIQKYDLLKKQENDRKADEQSWYGNTLRGASRFVTTLVSEVASMPGYIGGLVEAAFTEATIGEAMDNFWLNGIEAIKEDIQGSNLLKTYIPSDVQNGGIWDKMTSGSYWATSVADVGAMAVSFFVPGQVFKGLSLGSRALGTTGKLGKAGKAIDNVTAAGFNAVLESSMEARENFKNTYAQLQPKIKSGELTDEEARKIAGESAANVFKHNAILLTFTNFIDQAWLFGKTNKIAGRVNADMTISPVSNWSKTWGYGSKIAGSILKEGYLEEGTQYAIQKYNTSKALGEDEFESVWDTYIKSMDDSEFKESVFLGGLIGVGFGVSGQISDNKQTRRLLEGDAGYKPTSKLGKVFRAEREATKGIQGFLQDNYIKKYGSLQDLWKKDENGQPILDKNGKNVMDDKKYAEFVTELAKQDILRYQLHNLHSLKANPEFASESALKAEINFNENILKFNLLQGFMTIPEGRQILEKVLPTIIQQEAEIRKKLNNEELNVEQFKSDLLSKFDKYQAMHEVISSKKGSKIHLSEESLKTVPEFKKELEGMKLMSMFNEEYYNDIINDLDKQIAKLNSVGFSQHEGRIKELEKEKESALKEKEYIVLEGKSLYTKGGQQRIYDKYKKQSEARSNAVREAKSESTVETEASSLKNPTHADLYSQLTQVNNIDGKISKSTGAIEVIFEDQKEGTANKVYEFVDVNADGNVVVRDLITNKNTILKEDNTIDGRLIKEYKIAYKGEKVTKEDVAKKEADNKKAKTSTDESTAQSTDIDTVYSKKNDEELEKDWKESNPHPVFDSLELTMFQRTTGEHEFYAKNPTVFRQFLNLYDLVTDIQNAKSPSKELRKYTVKAFRKDNLPAEVNRETITSDAIVLVVYKGDKIYLSPENNQPAISFLPDPNRKPDIDKYTFKSDKTIENVEKERLLRKAIEDFEPTRQAILNSTEPPTFSLIGITNGFAERSSEATSLSGTVVKEGDESKVKLKIVQEGKDKGMVKVDYRGRLSSVELKNLRDTKESQRVLRLLQHIAAMPPSPERVELYKYLNSIIGIYKSGKRNKFSFSIKVDQDKNILGFDYGETEFISKEDIIEGKFGKFETFVGNKKHNVDKNYLGKNSSYIVYDVKDGELIEVSKYKNYTEYLVKNDYVKSHWTSIDSPQVLNSGFKLEVPLVNPPKPEVKDLSSEAPSQEFLDTLPIFEDTATDTKDVKVDTPMENQPVETPEVKPQTPEISEEKVDAYWNANKKLRPKLTREQARLEYINKLGKNKLYTGYHDSMSPEALAWFKNKFIGFDPEFVQEALIDGVSLGRVTASMRVMFSQKADDRTVFHEAFHVVFNFFTNKRQRNWLFEEVRSRTGKIYSNEQAEEFLAEEFEEFRLNPKEYKFNKGEEAKQSVFKRIFRAIVQFFNNLVGIKTIEDYFNMIENESFNKENAQFNPEFDGVKNKIKDFTESRSKLIVEHLNSKFFDVLIGVENGNLLPNILLELSETNINDIYDVVKVELELGSSVADRLTHAYFEDAVKEHKEFLKEYGVETELSLDEDQRTRDNAQFMDAMSVDTITQLPHAIKLLIASLPQKQGLGWRTDEGFTKNISFKNAVRTLQSELANYPTEKLLYKKLHDMGENHPEFNIFAKRLGLKSDGDTYIPDYSLEYGKELSQLRTSFFTWVVGTAKNVVQVDLRSSTKTSLQAPVQNTKVEKLTEIWKQNLTNKYNVKSKENFFNLRKGEYYLNQDAEFDLSKSIQLEGKVITKIKLGELYKLSSDQIRTTFDSSKNAKRFLDIFGMTLDERVPVELMQDFIIWSKDVIRYATTANDIFNSNIVKLDKEIRALAEAQSEFQMEGIPSQYRAGDGTMNNIITLPNYFETTINKIRNNDLDTYTPFNPATGVGNVQTYYSQWLNNKEVINHALIKDAKPANKPGINFDELSKGDMFNAHFNAIFFGISPVIPSAGRKLDYAIKYETSKGLNRNLTTNEMVSELKNYVKNEVLTTIAQNNNPNYKRLSKIQRHKGLAIFSGIDSLNKAVKEIKDLSPTEYIKAVEDLMRIHNSDIEKYLKKLSDGMTKDTMRLIEEFKIFVKSGQDWENLGFNTGIAASMFGEKVKVIPQHSLEALARNFAYRYFTNALEATKFEMGDIKVFNKLKGDKIVTELFKRATMSMSTKKALHGSETKTEEMNMYHPRFDGKAHTSNMKFITIQDIEVSSPIAPFLKNITGLNKYVGMNEYDAAGFSTMDGYRAYLLRAGKLTKGMDKTIQYEMQHWLLGTVAKDPKKLALLGMTKEELESRFSEHLPDGWKGVAMYEGEVIKDQERFDNPIAPTKPQGVGHIMNPELVDMGTIANIKLALFPPMPHEFIGTELETLMLTSMKHGIDFIFPSTSQKGETVGNLKGELTPIYDKDGSVKNMDTIVNEGYGITEFKWNDFGDQLDIDPSGKTRIVNPTQKQAVESLNIVENGQVIPKFKDIEHVVKEQHTLTNAKSERLNLEALPLLGLRKLSDTTFKILNKDKFKEAIKAEFTRNTYNKNVHYTLDAILDIPDGVFDMSVHKGNIEGVIVSMIDTLMGKHTTVGDMLVQRPATFYEPIKRNPTISNPALKFYRPIKENGTEYTYEEINNLSEADIQKVAPAEAMITLPRKYIKYVQDNFEGDTFEEKLDKFNKEIQKKFYDDVFTIVGNRVPTKDTPNIEILRIKKFLSPAHGNTIIVPTEIVAKSGSDFDIDKLFTLLNNVRFRGNKIEKIKFIDSVEEQYFQYVLGITNRLFDSQAISENLKASIEASLEANLEFLGSESKRTKGRYLNQNEYQAAIKEIIKEVKKQNAISMSEQIELLSFEEFSELPSEVRQSVKTIENRLNEITITKLLHPRNFSSFLAPDNTDYTVETTRKSISDYKDEDMPFHEQLSYNSALEYRYAQWQSQRVLSNTANAITGHAKFQYAPIKINPKMIRVVGAIHNQMGNIYDSVGRKISENHNEILSESVDSEKKLFPAIAQGNITPITANYHNFTAELGVSLSDRIKLTKSKKVKEYLKIRATEEAKFLEVQKKGKSKDKIIASLIKGKKKEDLLHNIYSKAISRSATSEDLDALESALDTFFKDFTVSDFEIHPEKALEYYLYLEQVSKGYASLIRLTKPETTKAKSIVHIREERKSIEKLYNLGIFEAESLTNLFENTYLKGFLKNKRDTFNMFKDYFLDTSNPDIEAALDELMLPYNQKATDEKIAVRNKWLSRIVTHVLHSQTVDGKSLSSKQYDLMFKGDSLVHRLKRIMYFNPDVKENLFLKELLLMSEEHIKGENVTMNFDYVKRYSARLGALEENSLINSFKELWDYPNDEVQEAARDLVTLAILQSGSINNTSKFIDIIPSEYSLPIISNIIKQFISEGTVLTDNDLKSIHAAAWYDAELTPRLHETQALMEDVAGTLKTHGVPYAFNSSDYLSQFPFLLLTSEREVTAKSGVKYKIERTTLLERIEINSNLVGYKPVSKKGRRGVYEVTPSYLDPSAMTSNNGYTADDRQGKAEKGTPFDENVQQLSNSSEDYEFDGTDIPDPSDEGISQANLDKLAKTLDSPSQEQLDQLALDNEKKEADKIDKQQSNITKQNIFTVTPIQSADKKAIVKASVANKFIGFAEGITGSSTESYRQQILEQNNKKVSAKGKMTFAYGNNKRNDVTSNTTLEAIKNGERTATTRYESDGHIDYWKNLKIGDIIEWEGQNGERIKVAVTRPLHKLVGSNKTAEQWSKLEGWSVDYFNSKVKPKLNEAWQIEYRPIQSNTVNSGNYSSSDIIFVSIGGKRGNETLRKEQQDKTIREALKAIEAGATLITDNKAYVKSSDYNEGEKRLAKNLEAKGYNYSEQTIDGQVLGVWKNQQQSSKISKEAKALWTIYGAKILEKHPNSSVQSVQKHIDQYGAEKMSNYYKKCYS